jgi:hypothetical protein
MSGMKQKSSWGNQSGAINGLLFPLLAMMLLLIGAIFFGVWAYGEREDYKNNVDAKISTAIVDAQKAEDAVKEKEFAERSKNPLSTYTGPSEFGSVIIKYPRTWSGYVANDTANSPYVNGYFSPGVVPSTEDENSVFALRVQVVQDSYSSLLDGYTNNNDTGDVTIQPYSAPKVPQVVGSRIEGKIFDKKTGSLVMLPLRDKTLEIWTESDQFKPDFNNIILSNLTFSP